MKYKVKRSRPGAGLGLFATRRFKKGEFIAEYTGLILTEEAADRHNCKYLFTINKKRVIDGHVRSNLARYINHACKPNAEAVIEDEKKVKIYAKKVIESGEEIAYHYGKEYFDDIIKPMGCKCDSCVLKRKQT